MKPVFDEERQFIEKSLGVNLPPYCWIQGTTVYLNSNGKDMILKFKANYNGLTLITDRILPRLIELKNKTWEEEILESITRLDKLEQESFEHITEFLNKYASSEIRMNYSGGKDSDVMYRIISKYADMYNMNYTVDYFNTTNETATTYKHIKNTIPKDLLYIHNPEMGWYNWLVDVKHYFFPSVLVRSCCAKYKEGESIKFFDKSKEYIMFHGVRKAESVKRSKYDWDINESWVSSHPDTPLNLPSNWHRFAPIINFTDVDVWLYLLRDNIPFNNMYRQGFSRTGCLFCPYSRPYNDLLIKEFYPYQYERWHNLLSKGYDFRTSSGRSVDWSKEEYVDQGKWKLGISKAHAIVSKGKSANAIKELSALKGISEELAAKYFDKKCDCGESLNITEVAMNLKLYGRQENVDDSKRPYKCAKCIRKDFGWDIKQYSDKVLEFRKGGCDLF